jgi:hypothetical protein
MFIWQLFLVRLHLAQFLFPLSEQVNGHVPACPIFLLAHPANGRNARLSQCMVYHPAVHEVFGEEAVMVDDLTYAAMYEHVANGHQATGTVDIFCNQIITQVAYMICQQQPSASAWEWNMLKADTHLSFLGISPVRIQTDHKRHIVTIYKKSE